MAFSVLRDSGLSSQSLALVGDHNCVLLIDNTMYTHSISLHPCRGRIQDFLMVGGWCLGVAEFNLKLSR